ncbi:MAG: sugar phosphate isomerase/epimerase [Sedimentisphaerales bacterium]|jgi:sugar phosphate isomerase/epimerase
MKIENLSRRTILKSGLVACAGICSLEAIAKGAEEMKKAIEAKKQLPVGLQLWTVREECKKDFPGTIAKVAKMGYNGVEFAGFFDRSAKDVRKMLDDNGLLCLGSHTALDLLSNEKLAATMEYNKTIGNKFVIVPYLERKQLTTKAAWLEKAKTFNELADKTRSEGVHIGYHSHAGDFAKIGDETPWDILFGNTNKEVVMQLDTGNCMQGGGDPIAVLKKYPGRALTIHLKEYSATNKKVVIGEGDIKWKELFEICETTGGTQRYIIEEESGAYPQLEAAELSLKGFKKVHG